MRGMRSLTVASTSALLAQIGLAPMVGATARATEVATARQPAEHRVWLPFVLVIALALITLPAFMPNQFGRDRRGTWG
jgi:hypothetical protein